VSDAAGALPLLGALAAQDITIADFAYGQPSLDAVFFALTGHGAAHETQQGETSGDAAEMTS